MIQVTIHYIKTHTTEYYIYNEEDFERISMDSLDDSKIQYEWYFYNEMALKQLLGGYYDSLEDVSTRNLERINERYMKLHKF